MNDSTLVRCAGSCGRMFEYQTLDRFDCCRECFIASAERSSVPFDELDGPRCIDCEAWGYYPFCPGCEATTGPCMDCGGKRQFGHECPF